MTPPTTSLSLLCAALLAGSASGYTLGSVVASPRALRASRPLCMAGFMADATVAELTRLFMTVKANRLTLQELRCVKHGALDLYVGADAGAGAGGGGGAIAVGRGPFRDCDWQSVYAALWT